MLPTSDLASHPSYDPPLSSKEAAAYLGVHYKTLLAMTRQKKLAVIKSEGGRLSYLLSDLNTYLQGRRESIAEPQSTDEIDWSKI